MYLRSKKYFLVRGAWSISINSCFSFSPTIHESCIVPYRVTLYFLLARRLDTSFATVPLPYRMKSTPRNLASFGFQVALNTFKYTWNNSYNWTEHCLCSKFPSPFRHVRLSWVHLPRKPFSDALQFTSNLPSQLTRFWTLAEFVGRKTKLLRTRCAKIQQSAIPLAHWAGLKP